jgi:hypothetical protein
MFSFIYIPTLAISLPFNTACKINEIFNKTLNMCVNVLKDDNIYDDNILEDDNIYGHRLLQRTGQPIQERELHREIINIRGMGRGTEPFQNEALIKQKTSINQISNEMYFFIIIMFGFFTYNYTKQIKKIFKS